MLYETTINNVKLDVYYDCLRTTDGYATGDSPTLYEIDFNSIETVSDIVNLMPILSEDFLIILEAEVIAHEASK